MRFAAATMRCPTCTAATTRTRALRHLVAQLQDRVPAGGAVLDIGAGVACSLATWSHGYAVTGVDLGAVRSSAPASSFPRQGSSTPTPPSSASRPPPSMPSSACTRSSTCRWMSNRCCSTGSAAGSDQEGGSWPPPARAPGPGARTTGWVAMRRCGGAMPMRRLPDLDRAGRSVGRCPSGHPRGQGAPTPCSGSSPA